MADFLNSSKHATMGAVLANLFNMQNQKSNVSVIVSFIIVVGVIILIVYALTHKSEDPEPVNTVTETQTTDQNITNKSEVKNETTSTKPMESNKRLLQNFIPVTGVATLEKKDLVVGGGAEVKAGATVSVHYTGAVAATGAIFQSSKDFGTDPITFPLANVIKGWTDGIPGMKVGGTRRLIIPSAQAYGTTPPPGSSIPANADLVFDVELVAVK
jgi:FKBP-type peptidyl-prolyl cis-trans isomerase